MTIVINWGWGTRLFWNMWAEGSLIDNGQAIQLNRLPVRAGTWNDALAKLANEHPESHLFVKTQIGWTYRGCLIFDTETAARVSLG